MHGGEAGDGGAAAGGFKGGVRGMHRESMAHAPARGKVAAHEDTQGFHPEHGTRARR